MKKKKNAHRRNDPSSSAVNPTARMTLGSSSKAAFRFSRDTRNSSPPRVCRRPLQITTPIHTCTAHEPLHLLFSMAAGIGSLKVGREPETSSVQLQQEIIAWQPISFPSAGSAKEWRTCRRPKKGRLPSTFPMGSWRCSWGGSLWQMNS